ncbi:MAG: EAL domain-containing protein, partial [Clostridiales bacterium]|nr:EAL domain-containing protein [Clostridiales bacterium]
MRQPFAVCQFLEKGVVTLVVSDGFCELFGYDDRTQAYSDMNQNMFRDIHPDDTALFTNAILSFGTEGGRLDVLYRAKKKDVPGYKIIHLNGERVDTDDGLRLAQIWFTEEGEYNEEGDNDPGSGKVFREENRRGSAYYDYLTGLPNISYFLELAEVGRKTMLDQGGLPALLYIDLSGMKSFNHKYGFAEGDKLLRHFSALLSRTFGAESCCHINADHFAAVADENGLEDKLDRLFQEWRDMKNNVHLPICVGIYPNRIEEVPVGMAYDRAKITCDAIKSTYASSFNYYSNELSDGIIKQHYILENFERALSENWIQVYYQPIMRAINGKVCDEEALARWIDPVKGLLSPADFIPYLEDAGLIYKLDLYVLEQVLEHIKAKEAEGFYIVPQSINLSRSDFDSCDMVEEIKRRVDAAGVSRDRINIEITESVIGRDFDYMKGQIERF